MNTYLKFPDHKPHDDQTVLAVHDRCGCLPHKCYFDEQTQLFISAEFFGHMPILVTHWMPLPTFRDTPDDVEEYNGN